MRISTKGRFAVNAMVDLALRESAGPVALATIGRRQGISLSYLEQLFGGLRTAGLVQSSRGPGGGYRLGRAPVDISVADIVLAVDDGDLPVDHRPGAPATAALWLRLAEAMRQEMAAISLHSLVEAQSERGEPVAAPPPRRAIAPLPTARRPHTTAPNSVFALASSMGC
ncbi:MAG: Rrf2 family transcriptional regulator [Burkholderiales bacterium]|nr:Rrf2 family transcriptional regulator [Burkholderiales bacterium]